MMLRRFLFALLLFLPPLVFATDIGLGTIEGLSTPTKNGNFVGTFTDPSLANNALKGDANGKIVSAGESARTFVYTATTGTPAATSGTQYMVVSGAGLSATETNMAQVLPAVTVTGMQCGTATAVPGGGKSWTMVLRDGTSLANCGSFSCAISGTSDNCSSTSTCSPTAGHGLDIQITPAGTPTTSAITCFIQGTRTS